MTVDYAFFYGAAATAACLWLALLIINHFYDEE